MIDNYREDDEFQQEEDGDTIEIKADPKQTPIRIDKFLMDRVEGNSRSRIQNAIKEGLVTVNSQFIKPNYKIQPGDEVKIVLPGSEYPSEVIPENIPLDIRYEDDDVLIVFKPAGMVVHPGIGNFRGTLVNALTYHFKQMPMMPGNTLQPGLVHRIDKDTSGLLVVAKNEKALYSLAQQFFKHTIHREYLALVWGSPDPPQATVTINIGRHPHNRTLVTTFPEGDLGRHSITHYRVLEDLYYVSLVSCKLETGRTHQIRVHMQYLGHPIFSDSRYGGDQIVKGTVFSKYRQFVQNALQVCARQALHAKSIGFVHPATGEDMYFDSELPDDMSQVIDKWRSYVQTRKEILDGDDS